VRCPGWAAGAPAPRLELPTGARGCGGGGAGDGTGLGCLGGSGILFTLPGPRSLPRPPTALLILGAGLMAGAGEGDVGLPEGLAPALPPASCNSPLPPVTCRGGGLSLPLPPATGKTLTGGPVPAAALAIAAAPNLPPAGTAGLLGDPGLPSPLASDPVLPAVTVLLHASAAAPVALALPLEPCVVSPCCWWCCCWRRAVGTGGMDLNMLVCGSATGPLGPVS
jgi:hypothetical protein